MRLSVRFIQDDLLSMFQNFEILFLSQNTREIFSIDYVWTNFIYTFDLRMIILNAELSNFINSSSKSCVSYWFKIQNFDKWSTLSNIMLKKSTLFLCHLHILIAVNTECMIRLWHCMLPINIDKEIFHIQFSVNVRGCRLEMLHIVKIHNTHGWLCRCHFPFATWKMFLLISTYQSILCDYFSHNCKASINEIR